VTVKEHDDWLPLVSVAVQVTVVVPCMKTDPEAGEQTIEPMPQLSDTVGAGYSTTDESEQPSRAAPVWSMSAGQTMAGAWVSLTVTVNEHIAELPDGSVAVQVTVVVPTAKNEPEAGAQTTVVIPAQLSDVVGAG
jgi:hypothetical protein